MIRRALYLAPLLALVSAASSAGAATGPAASPPAAGKPIVPPKAAAAPAATAPAKTGAQAPARAPAEDEVAPAKPEIFDEALALHHRGAHSDSAPLFHAFLRGSPRTADNYEWAEYFLAIDLSELGFSHGAIVFLSDITKTRARAELLPEALAALERITAKVPYDTELVEREVIYGTDFGFVPPSVQDYVSFHKGMIALKDGQVRWAFTQFDKLKAGTEYHAQVRLVRAVRRMNRDADADQALADFEGIAADAKAPRDVRNEARVSAARLYFERGLYDKAQSAYDSVDLPELDPGRGQIYLEKAWTYYRVGDSSRAMGLLLALDAPSFRELFLPEKYVLASLIYKDRCHYLPAKRAARGFTRRYKGALTLIRERGDLKDDPRLLAAALQQDATVRRAGEFVELLGRERDRLDDFAGRFQASGLTAALRKLYERG
jgi:hypothetical protein